MGRARGANAIMALAFETPYGTPPVSGYRKAAFISSSLGATQGLIESDLLGLGRAPADPTYDVVVNDGDVVVPLEPEALALWFSLLLGAPTESTPSTGILRRTFASGAATLPSASIEIGFPDRPTYSTHYGVRANMLQISMQRSGLTTATIGLIAKGETVASLTSNAGTVGDYGAVRRFAQATGRILMDSADLGEVVSAEIGFSNALEKDETIRPDGEINDVDPGMPSASLTLVTKFADATLMNKATSKAPVALEFTWSKGDESLSLLFPRVFLPRTKRPISGPGGIQQSIDAVASAGAGQPLMIATMNTRMVS